MGSLAAHRGDRAEATGLFHPFSHSAPPPSHHLPHPAREYSLTLSRSMPTSPSLPFSSLSYIYFFSPFTCLFFLLRFILKYSSQPPYLPIPHLFFSFHLPLSLPCPPYVFPLDGHVRCCCAVDKTQSLSHPSSTWDPWLLLCVCVCMWERQWERDKKTKRKATAEQTI